MRRRGYVKKIVLSVISAAALIFVLNACTTIPPDLEMAAKEIFYISPKNGDGIQDTLSVPVTLTPAQRMVMFGYKIEVIAADGMVVRSMEAEGKKPGFLQKKTAIEVPPALTWDGRDNDNIFVPDGDYKILFKAWDDKLNSVEGEPLHVVVDNTPPSVELTIPYRIFSPNGDGNKDSIPIAATSSKEDQWTGVFFGPGGKKAASFTWKDNHPKELLWKGTDDNGTLLADGIYSYEASATDRAGNTGTGKITGISINTKPSPLSLTLDRTHFSPNGDGTADTVAISPSYPEEGVDGWGLTITDKNNEVVKTAVGTDFSAFIWDGYSNQDTLAPDGEYFVKFSVLYENGNNPSVNGGPITVDTEAPYAYVVPGYRIFSPDGDGNRDTLTLNILGSSMESQWTVDLLDSTGARIGGMQWSGWLETVVWDGTDRNGKPVGDGTYTLRLQSTDEGGNTFTEELKDIRIDTRATPVSVSLSDSAFSPNADGQKDVITITPHPGLEEGILREEMKIADSTGKVIRQFNSAELQPYTWNGLTDSGATAADGNYSAEITIEYEKGNIASASSSPFLLDTVYPSVELRSDYTLFSPDGDMLLDTINLQITSASREDKWTGEILDQEGNPVAVKNWNGLPGDYLWNGKGSSGEKLNDGVYVYHVSATDSAGNTGSGKIPNIRIDTRPTPISINTGYKSFSPNNDGIKDTVSIIPQLGLLDGLLNWKIIVTGPKKNTVKEFTGTAAPTTKVWDGKTTAGQTAADGEYILRFEAVYANGRNPVELSDPVIIDTKAPEITVTPEYTLFSPNGDGRRDILPMKQQSSTENLWTASILNASGTEVKNFEWNGTAGNVQWDGKDISNTLAPDGQYTYKVSAVDPAGNSISKTVEKIQIDTRQTLVRLESLASGLSPNNDGIKDTISFNVAAGINEGISGWELNIVKSGGTVKISAAKGKDKIPQTLVWNGITAGKTAAEGNYYAEVTLEYEKGNIAQTRSAEFKLDVSPPVTTVRMAPLPFSPDDDGENDTVSISLTAADESKIDSWRLVILDPVGNMFMDFSGTDVPAKPIIWNGKSLKGELVQAASDYSVEFRTSDILGNNAVNKNKLPIDILVMKDGDRLKIQLSSIYFAPNSAEFLPGKEEENRKTLARLAEILKKYEQYAIGIEGHAVRIYWYDEAMGQYEERESLMPLSTKRAETVKTALIGLGIRAGRMTTVGYGGMRPVVPHGDLDNRWKNRRVEFILKK